MDAFELRNVRRYTAFLAALALPLVLAGCHTPHKVAPPLPTAVAMPLTGTERDSLYQSMFRGQHFLSAKDYTYLIQIRAGINRTQTISDADTAFLVQKLDTFAAYGPSPQVSTAEILVLDHTFGTKPKHLTSSQQRSLYDAILPFTRSLDTNVQAEAPLALATTRDPRAVPVLQALSSTSPAPAVKARAIYALKALQRVLRGSSAK